MSWPPIQRAPCGGWKVPQEVTLGGPTQHFKDSENGINVYANTTTVDNPICDVPACAPPDPCPDPIPPYCRDHCHPEDFTVGTDAYNCHVATCGPYNPAPLNTYALSDPLRKKNYAVCRKIGFKNCYAMKSWHGQWPFNSKALPGWIDSMTPLGACVATSGDLTIPGTKYLASSATASYDEHFHGASIGSSSAARGCSVDRYSGKRTFTGSETGTDAGHIAISVGLINTYQHYGPGDLVGAFNAAVAAYIPADPTMVTWTGSGTSWTGYFYSDHIGTLAVTVTLDLPGGHYRLEFANGHYTEDLVATGTSLVYSLYTQRTNDPYDGYTNSACSIGLSGAYTSGDVNGDADALLAYWDFCDDLQQPWRYDEAVTVGPLMTRNERGATVPDLNFAVGFTDDTLPPAPEMAEGAVMGAPNPPGYEPYFDFHHITWALAGVDGTGELWLPSCYGAAAPGYLPSATQWIDNFWSQLLPSGPFVAYNRLTNPIKFTSCLKPIPIFTGTLVKCKWAQTINFAKPTHNFARPCGDDIDETDVTDLDCALVPPKGTDLRWPTAPCGCAVSVAITGATNATPIVVTTASAHGLATGDRVTICKVLGNTAANGTFLVVVLSATTVQLWTNADPSVMVAGSGAYTSGGQMTTEEPNVWNDTWKKGEFTIDEWQYDFRAFLESYRTRQQYKAFQRYNDGCSGAMPPCDPTSCTLPAQLDPYNYLEIDPDPAAGTGGALGQTIGTGSYWLKTMTRTQKCIAHSVCQPSCVYIQPASPACLSNGIFQAMPTLALDERYGTFWAARVNEWMTDPLWVAPGKNHMDVLCADGGELGACDITQEDDGGCVHDYVAAGQTVCVYPTRNYEESLAAAPGGAPALPGDALTIGCPNYITNANHNPAIGNPGDCEGPLKLVLDWFDGSGGCGAGYEIFSYPQKLLATWAIFLRQEACVAAAGRFATEYRKNGVVA